MCIQCSVSTFSVFELETLTHHHSFYTITVMGCRSYPHFRGEEMGHVVV